MSQPTHQIEKDVHNYTTSSDESALGLLNRPLEQNRRSNMSGYFLTLAPETCLSSLVREQVEINAHHSDISVLGHLESLIVFYFSHPGQDCALVVGR